MIIKTKRSEQQQISDHIGKKMLTTKEAASYLRLSVQHIRKLSREGKIPSYQPNRKNIYFDIEDLDYYLRVGKRMSEEEIIRRTNRYNLKSY
ncbi:helix-turn-helix domain-containing protein [Elizabethkingia anophelis]|nr:MULTISPECIES: helix-turn-helix domain-containing protein [unclassified Elizabethkingia]MCT3644058.1 helix-turn-helix domain-containing protein [Elizabethkingia anophelis]MCT3676941.1 helix-turn-helix domain-containing protein [Elizabethkingia anophelis]MCT3684376.1 helix-turn-helix domain-containing protein [Elizabethkingia anophelis]MDX8560022.1 helix-turn-helix domain-containing protein [Elizabethkingia sp. HX ZCH]MDX8578610.1 helix-turn-helix domain-containing protein [Elizabethkingia sp